MNKSGQITLFVIVAIVIVGVITILFVYRDNLFGSNIPASLAPVYSLYSGCLSEELSNGVSLLKSQGGRIEIGDLAYASDFNPFSSHLNFLGFKIPYWYGYSENNLIIENMPSVNDMENDLEAFVEQRLNDCDFSDFYARGFVIEKNAPEVSVNIEDNKILVSVDAPLSVSFDEDSARKSNHELIYDTNLGVLYNSANLIYNYERQTLFLENYALDVLQSYAPVDGVDIQCSPKIWKTNEVVNEVRNGLQANIGAIGFSGDFSKDQNYFNVQSAINEPVNLVYLSESFPSKLEITPATQTLMIAEPVGTQEGMGVMGFCYVPYHFVYDLRFPVLIQVGDGIDAFQFPMVVDIDNNVVKDGIVTQISEEQEVDLCSFAEGNVKINTYDSNLNPIPANLSYNCFDSLCNLGETSISGDVAELDSKIPICVNGYLIASAEGYSDSKISFSSNSENFAELILDKEYDIDVEIKLGGQTVRNLTAVVHFTSSDGHSTSAIIPESTTIELKEGLYDIKAYVYGRSNVIIPATTKTECFEVNRGGVSGLFGAKTEKCVQVEIPSTKIDYALKGGGKLIEYYLLESELESGKITIDVSELATPNSLEQLQYNFEVFDTLGLEVSF